VCRCVSSRNHKKSLWMRRRPRPTRGLFIYIYIESLGPYYWYLNIIVGPVERLVFSQPLFYTFIHYSRKVSSVNKSHTHSPILTFFLTHIHNLYRLSHHFESSSPPTCTAFTLLGVRMCDGALSTVCGKFFFISFRRV